MVNGSMKHYIAKRKEGRQQKMNRFEKKLLPLSRNEDTYRRGLWKKGGLK